MVTWRHTGRPPHDYKGRDRSYAAASLRMPKIIANHQNYLTGFGVNMAWFQTSPELPDFCCLKSPNLLYIVAVVPRSQYRDINIFCLSNCYFELIHFLQLILILTYGGDGQILSKPSTFFVALTNIRFLVLLAKFYWFPWEQERSWNELSDKMEVTTVTVINKSQIRWFEKQ